VPLRDFDRKLKEELSSSFAGIDEAGRGPLAGPVVAAACLVDFDVAIDGINDSKQLNASKRESLYQQIISHPGIQIGVGIISPEEIDQINILQATIKAMIEAVNKLPRQPPLLLVDGLKLPHPTIPSRKLIKGDTLSYAIAAASIVAKVTRDTIMVQLDKEWPQYGFAQHKGYGTAKHRAAIAAHGPCPHHRRSFAWG
jgi:ribonuclease HII